MVNYNGVNLQSQNWPQFHIENLSKQLTMTSHIPKSLLKKTALRYD